MNKYNIKDFLRVKLQKYLSTLKETSLDTENAVYLCNDTATQPVYDFDGFVRESFDDERNLPCSPDAVALGEKKLYFVEFKNQVPAKIDTANMKRKFKNGTELLQKLLSDFNPSDVEFIFCVVHRAENTQRNARNNPRFDPRHIQSMVAKFGLDNLNKNLGGFYTHIIAEDVSFYKDKFESLNC